MWHWRLSTVSPKLHGSRECNYSRAVAVQHITQDFQECIVAESSDKPAPAAAAAQPARPQQNQVAVDDSKAMSLYANFCRVTGTPEELIIDFGLNAQQPGASTEAVHCTQRIITNFYTAKRLLQALHLTLQRHEAAFGVIETDIQKRVTPGFRG
jgi:hypothetical protein